MLSATVSSTGIPKQNSNARSDVTYSSRRGNARADAGKGRVDDLNGRDARADAGKASRRSDENREKQRADAKGRSKGKGKSAEANGRKIEDMARDSNDRPP